MSTEITNVRLIYFPIRGLGEQIRWVLTFAGVPFEDVRLSDEEWAKMKPDTPTHKLPILEFTDKDGKPRRLIQSASIVRCLGWMLNLAGKGPIHFAECDILLECIRDCHQQHIRIHFEKDEARKAEMIEKLNSEIGPNTFNFLEKRLKDNGGKHFVGESFTFADVMVGYFVNEIQQLKPANEFEMFKQRHPTVYAFAQEIWKHPNVKAYLEKRPASAF